MEEEDRLCPIIPNQSNTILTIMENCTEGEKNYLTHCRSVNNFIKKEQDMHVLDLSKSEVRTQDKNIGRTERSMIPQKAFNFESVSRKTCTADYVSRIHGKIGTKRSGGKVVLAVRRQKKAQSKENRLSNTEFNALQKSEAVLNGKTIYEENPSNFISIKSYQPEGRISSMDQTIRSHNRNFSNLTEENLKAQGDVYQIFKEVKRKLQKDQEFSTKIQRKRNCFFTNLKKRLQQEVRKTSELKQRDGMTLLIQGCHAMQHSKVAKNAYLKVQRQIKSQRPRTATPKTGLSLNRSINRATQRPKSCRTSNLQSPRFLKEASLKYLDKKERSTVNEKRPTSDALGSLQSASSSSLYCKTGRPNTARQCSTNLNEISCKLAQIISNCDGERIGSDLNSNMNTFQYYCKRMDEGMNRANQKIQEVQCMQID